MNPSDVPNPPVLLTPVPARWTPDRQRVFLTALLAGGNVTQAARAAGMSPASAHRLRRRLAGTVFDRTWTQALALHARRLADPFALDPATRSAAAGAVTHMARR